MVFSITSPFFHLKNKKCAQLLIVSACAANCILVVMVQAISPSKIATVRNHANENNDYEKTGDKNGWERNNKRYHI